MKKINDVRENIKLGAVLTVLGTNGYCACMSRYDGRILKDVIEVELVNFLDALPNIKNAISSGNYLRVEYDLTKMKYQSSIMQEVRTGDYNEIPIVEVVSDLSIDCKELEDSLIGLDTKIAIKNKKENLKRKVLY